MDKAAVGLIVGLVVLVCIIGASMGNREDLQRLQQLKNKRRFGGKRLPAHEMEELDRLARKYWWY